MFSPVCASLLWSPVVLPRCAYPVGRSPRAQTVCEKTDDLGLVPIFKKKIVSKKKICDFSFFFLRFYIQDIIFKANLINKKYFIFFLSLFLCCFPCFFFFPVVLPYCPLPRCFTPLRAPTGDCRGRPGKLPRFSFFPTNARRVWRKKRSTPTRLHWDHRLGGDHHGETQTGRHKRGKQKRGTQKRENKNGKNEKRKKK